MSSDVSITAHLSYDLWPLNSMETGGVAYLADPIGRFATSTGGGPGILKNLIPVLLQNCWDKTRVLQPESRIAMAGF